jgi:hypothetical protein
VSPRNQRASRAPVSRPAPRGEAPPVRVIRGDQVGPGPSGWTQLIGFDRASRDPGRASPAPTAAAAAAAYPPHQLIRRALSEIARQNEQLQDEAPTKPRGRNHGSTPTARNPTFQSVRIHTRLLRVHSRGFPRRPGASQPPGRGLARRATSRARRARTRLGDAREKRTSGRRSPCNSSCRIPRPSGSSAVLDPRPHPSDPAARLTSY